MVSTVVQVLHRYSSAAGTIHLSNGSYFHSSTSFLSFGLGAALACSGMTEARHWQAGCVALTTTLTTVAQRIGVGDSALAACSMSGDDMASRCLTMQLFDTTNSLRFKNELLDMGGRVALTIDGTSMCVPIREKRRLRDDFTHKIVLSQVPHEFCFQGLTRLLLQGFGYDQATVLSEELARIKGVDTPLFALSGTVVAYVRVPDGDVNLSKLTKRYNLGGLTMSVSVDSATTFTHPVPLPTTLQDAAPPPLQPQQAPPQAPPADPPPATPATNGPPPVAGTSGSTPFTQHVTPPATHAAGRQSSARARPTVSPRVRARAERGSSDEETEAQPNTRRRSTQPTQPQPTTPVNLQDNDEEYGASTSGREADYPGLTAARVEFNRRLEQFCSTWFAAAHVRLSTPLKRRPKEHVVKARYPQWNVTGALLDALQEYSTCTLLASSAHDRTEFMNWFWEVFRQPLQLDDLKEVVNIADLPAAVLCELTARAQDVQRQYEALYSTPSATACTTRSTCRHPPSAATSGQRAAGL